MLYKFREAQLIDLGLARSRNRPRNPRHCDSVNDAQGYRREILQEISFKVTRVKDGKTIGCGLCWSCII